MYEFWRRPLLPIGIVLLVLGLGNWTVSRGRLVQYERRAQVAAPVERTDSLEGYERLTQRTNATLLERLHRRPRDYGVLDARRDFYSVVQSGGRLITVVGLLLLGIGLLQAWRERRLLRGPLPPPALPPATADGA